MYIRMSASIHTYYSYSRPLITGYKNGDALCFETSIHGPGPGVEITVPRQTRVSRVNRNLMGGFGSGQE